MKKPEITMFNKFAEKFNFPDEQKLIDTLKATAFKTREGVVSDEQMITLLIVADQYGLNPFTREIYAYPDKQNGIVPVVGVDGWLRIVNKHQDFDGLEFVLSSEWVRIDEQARDCPKSIECVIYRKDRAHPVKITEYLDEVYRPPFTSNRNGNPYVVQGPWQTFTKRMLRHKALIQCARVAFGFVGIYDQDEAERIIEGQASVIGNEDYIPPGHIEKMAGKLIERATKANAWQPALDYINSNFTGFDQNYLLDEIKKARGKSEAAVVLQPSGEAAANPVSASESVPINGQKSAKTHLQDAKAALN